MVGISNNINPINEESTHLALNALASPWAPSSFITTATTTAATAITNNNVIKREGGKIVVNERKSGNRTKQKQKQKKKKKKNEIKNNVILKDLDDENVSLTIISEQQQQQHEVPKISYASILNPNSTDTAVIAKKRQHLVVNEKKKSITHQEESKVIHNAQVLSEVKVDEVQNEEIHRGSIVLAGEIKSKKAELQREKMIPKSPWKNPVTSTNSVNDNNTAPSFAQILQFKRKPQQKNITPNNPSTTPSTTVSSSKATKFDSRNEQEIQTVPMINPTAILVRATPPNDKNIPQISNFNNSTLEYGKKKTKKKEKDKTNTPSSSNKPSKKSGSLNIGDLLRVEPSSSSKKVRSKSTKYTAKKSINSSTNPQMSLSPALNNNTIDNNSNILITPSSSSSFPKQNNCIPLSSTSISKDYIIPPSTSSVTATATATASTKAKKTKKKNLSSLKKKILRERFEKWNEKIFADESHFILALQQKENCIQFENQQVYHSSNFAFVIYRNEADALKDYLSFFSEKEKQQQECILIFHQTQSQAELHSFLDGIEQTNHHDFLKFTKCFCLQLQKEPNVDILEIFNFAKKTCPRNIRCFQNKNSLSIITYKEEANKELIISTWQEKYQNLNPILLLEEEKLKNDFTVEVQNLFTEDDYEDEECMEETKQDFTTLAHRFGIVSSTSFNTGKNVMHITYNNKLDHNQQAVLKAWHDLKIGGTTNIQVTVLTDNTIKEQEQQMKSFRVILKQVFTEDDFEDEDCMNETQNDIQELASNIATVLNIDYNLHENLVLISYSSIEKEKILEAWSHTKMGGEPILFSHEEEQCKEQQEDSYEKNSQNVFAINLKNIFTEDDLEDEECMEETKNDIVTLANEYGPLLNIHYEPISLDIHLTYSKVSQADCEIILRRWCDTRIAGNLLEASILSSTSCSLSKQTIKESTFQILLHNLMTIDDLEDDECFEESKTDITNIAKSIDTTCTLKDIKFERESQGNVIISYWLNGENNEVDLLVKMWSSMCINGEYVKVKSVLNHSPITEITAPAPAEIKSAEASEDQNNEKQQSDEALQNEQASSSTSSNTEKENDKPATLYSGDKRIPESFAKFLRVPKIPNSGMVREYANTNNSAIMSSSYDSETIKSLTIEMLTSLMKFQIRGKDDLNAKARRRLVFGLREVARGIRAQKVKMIVMANNLDEYGALDEKLQDILKLATQNEETCETIPVIFELSKRQLGKAIGKTIKISVVGIQNADGAYEPFKKLKKAFGV